MATPQVDGTKKLVSAEGAKYSGFAAAQCGKPLAYRLQILRRGYASDHALPAREKVLIERPTLFQLVNCSVVDIHIHIKVGSRDRV